MSSSIDQRVVAMKFDNAAFSKAAEATLKQLDALNKGLQLTGATKGLSDLGTAAKGVDVSHVEKGVQGIADKFKAMSVVAITALATITSKAIETGTALVKSLTIDPIKQGFQEYETNLNSIQTVLANTSKAGTTLKDVNKALAELNEYSDQTIYNFSEMAKNIGTFTAAGVSLQTATASIKGIANLAALSGANSENASRAMYQLSQAISAGKVSLEDWNSVVNAGIGGKVFQDALIQTARNSGVAIDSMIKKAGSFRLTLEKGWLSGKILTDTLMQFTGDLTDAQLKSQGYSAKQIKEIQELARIAKAAATEVKTASQLINTLQEAVGSGWARTWELIFGDFDEAKKLWTGVNNVLGDFINKSADARNKVLGDWKALGGRQSAIDAIGNAFNALIRVVSPIRDAFRDIFPAVTGKQLYDITVAIERFTETLSISDKTMDKIRRTFAGVFAVLDIGWSVVKEGARFLFELFGVVTQGSGSILDFTANIGDFLVGLRDAIKNGEGLHKFFQGLLAVIEPPVKFLKSMAKLLGSLFDGFDGEKAADAITGTIGKLSPLEKLGNIILKVWEKLFSNLGKIFQKFFSIASKVGDFFADFGVNLSDKFANLDLSKIMGVLGGGAFIGVLLSIKTFISGASEALDGLTDSLGAMQNTLRAATLLQIALAVGVLTVSVVTLSKVDAAGLTRSLTAITVMFTQLLGAMLIFEKFSGFKGFAKMPFVAASMILMGVAINVLAIAVKSLAELSWDELGRGLAGVTALLGVVIATMHLMPNPAGMISSSVGIVILAAAIKILVSSVTDLAGLSWQEIAKGLTGVAAILAALALYTMFAKINATGLLSGAGIILIAVAIKILASAIKDISDLSWQDIAKGMAVMAGALLAIGLALTFIPPSSILSAAAILVVATSLGLIGDAVAKMSGLSWGEIGRGMTVLAGALTLIGLALTLIPPTSLLSAAAILIVAASLSLIVDALQDMGGMSWTEIAKGLVTLAGALLIIAVAVNAMTGALAGAAALLIVAASLAIITPVLKTLGEMSWGEILKGLVALAAVLVILGVAGLLLQPVVPTLIGLGLAITLIGAGLALAGAGVFLFATGLTALSVSGAAATAALVGMVGALLGLLPTIIKVLGQALVALANAIETAAPAIVAAIVAVIYALLVAIEKLIPKVVEVILKLLTLLLETLVVYQPRLVDAGLKLIAGLLEGIAKRVPKVVEAAVDLAVKFLKALSDNIPKLVQAGVDYIINFINGVADAIRKNSAKLGEAGGNLASAIVEGMIKGLLAGGGKIAEQAKNVAKKALDAAKAVLGIKSPSKEFFKVGEDSGEGMSLGLKAVSNSVEDSAANLGEKALDSLRESMSDLSDIVNANIDTTPTIRPVLDLTDVQKNANKMGGMFNTPTIKPSSSGTTARYLATTVRPKPPGSSDDSANSSAPGGVTYIQNNTSPKALSSTEIYRQTKNQLSTAKGGLPT